MKKCWVTEISSALFELCVSPYRNEESVFLIILVSWFCGHEEPVSPLQYLTTCVCVFSNPWHIIEIQRTVCIEVNNLVCFDRNIHPQNHHPNQDAEKFPSSSQYPTCSGITLPCYHGSVCFSLISCKWNPIIHTLETNIHIHTKQQTGFWDANT